MRMRKALVALSVGACVALPAVAQASSHREAPFVTKNPKVDGTDFYMFDSYEPGHAGMVTIVADYLPLQDGFGGPNFFELDEDALYEIMLDNTGDCAEDVTFQFRFSHALGGGGTGILLPVGPADAAVNVAIPLINIGAVSTPSNMNVTTSYTIDMVTGNRRTGTVSTVTNASTGATSFFKPIDNIGVKSFPNGYNKYAARHIQPINIPGCATPGQVFVGQRAEPFAVNLGPTFDLIDAPLSVIAGGSGPQVVPNPLAKKNVTSIVLELPAACITQTTGANAGLVGGWTTASVRQARVINPNATYTVPSAEGGAWAQVSRLSNPLVNELVIGLPDKDKFNSSQPKDDPANFATYVTNPTLPVLIDAVFGTGFQPMVFPRADLVEAFLTGVPGVNQFSGGGTCEMLRLNTGLPPTPAASQQYLGAALCVPYGVVNTGNAGCDVAGFPNGRRPGDDVVDLALDVMEGYLLPQGSAPLYATGTTLLTDGVQQCAVSSAPGCVAGSTTFDTTFPYLKTPTQGANGDGT